MSAQTPLSGEHLFASDTILTLVLSGDLKTLLNDRGEDPQYHPLQLSYMDSSGPETLDIKARARGNFRRKKENCDYPPLWIKFNKASRKGTGLFAGQSKLKLVMPCVSDRYVIQEYLVYQLNRTLTAQSFRVRLVRLKLADHNPQNSPEHMYAFLLEDEDKMAQRLDGEIIKVDRLRPKALIPKDYFRMTVFQYLIGNTDWSIEYRHNIKLIKKPEHGFPLPVAYDFDHAGIVNAPYAQPAEALNLSSIRERLYRGYCLDDLKKLQPTFDLFREKRDSIYAIYRENMLLDERYRKSTLKFLDDFYEILENPKKRERDFAYPCLEKGTGRVIIRGLNN